MSTRKQPHGATFQQGIILGILAKEGPMTSSEIASRYDELTGAEIAYNYQFIVTRRMAEGGLITSGKVKNPRGQKIFRWAITPAGKKLLASVKKLNGAFSKVA